MPTHVRLAPMKIWIAGEIDEVKRAAATGLVSAVVTNPAVMARWTAHGRKMEEVCADVCSVTALPLYVQLRGPSTGDFLREWQHLSKISPLLRPKFPSTLDGLTATAAVARDGGAALVTTVCSLPQAWVSAVAGASAICPYLGRLNDAGEDAATLLQDIATVYSRHAVPTEIIPASVRSVEDVTIALRAGAHGVIIFWPLFEELLRHPVTTHSLAGFEANWTEITHRLPTADKTLTHDNLD